MAKKNTATPPTAATLADPPPQTEPARGPRVVGSVVMRPIESVKPNDWNPNRMTPFMKESLRRGLLEDGWLSSQALLVWGKDDKGVDRNVIIDGEHRWYAARELGFKEGPMVLLNGVSLAQAKALTVKMDQKRGSFDKVDLGTLLRDIQFDLGAENLSLTMGIEDEHLMRLLAEPPTPLPPPAADPMLANGEPPPDIPASSIRMVQLFFNDKTHAEFTRCAKELAVKYETKNVTDTTLEGMRRALAASVKS